MIKKRFMELLWRLQASQTVIGMIFYPLTLTGVFYPYLRERTDNFGLGQGSVLGGMLILFLLILGTVVAFGLTYDKLRFWKEQNIVAIERNPYGSYKLTVKEIFWMKMWALAIKANPDISPEAKKQLEFYEKWIESNFGDDRDVKAEFDRIVKMIPCAAPPTDKPA